VTLCPHGAHAGRYCDPCDRLDEAWGLAGDPAPSVALPRPWTPVTPPRLWTSEEIAAVYRRHGSLRAVSEQTGLPKSTVYCKLVRAGVPRAPCGQPRGDAHRRAKPALRARIAKLRARGLSLSQIAREVGLASRQAVAWHVKVIVRQGGSVA